ncbi:MAG: BatA and WFA domain-containing protein [Planctomycetota bacterium]|nr:BatA and WFA domain-containing protein [Planctomycetota bacterium]
MSYLTSSFLSFLPLATIPVVLYLIFRRRKNDVDWGATYILKKTLKAKNKQNIWRQIVILTIRTVFIALLVLGFARPNTPQGDADSSAFPHGPGALHRIVLFDNSGSMVALDETTSREESAKSALREAMLGMRAGDTFQLVLLSRLESAPSASPKLVTLSCPINEDEALATISKIVLSDKPVDFEDSLRLAKDLVAGSHTFRKQLIFVSDFTDKDHASIEKYEGFAKAMLKKDVEKASADELVCTALFLGRQNSQNVGILSLTLGTDLLFKGQPTQVYVTVQNFGGRATEATMLTLFVNDKHYMQEPCGLNPRQQKTFVFPFVPEINSQIEARLSKDVFEPDNQIRRAVQVSDRLKLLVLHRDESEIENDFLKDTEFLRRGLDMPAKASAMVGTVVPEQFDATTAYRRREMGLKTSTHNADSGAIKYDVGYSFKPTYRKVDQITSGEIAGYDVIVCSQVNILSEPVKQAVMKFVRQGGGLFIGVGPETEAGLANQAFDSLLPYSLGTPHREITAEFKYDRYFNIQAADIPAGLFKEFEDRKNGNIADGRIYNHFRLELPEEPAEENVVMRLTNGDPLLVQKRIGKGVVFLWTTTIGGSWNSLVVNQSFMPLLMRTMNYAASFKPLSRNLVPGQPIIHEVSEIPGTLFLATPNFELVPLERILHQGRQYVRFERTDKAGVYELQRSDGAAVASFFIRNPQEESDLLPLKSEKEKQLITAFNLRTARGSERLPNHVSELKEALTEAGETSELTSLLLIAVLLLITFDAALVKLWFS